MVIGQTPEGQDIWISTFLPFGDKPISKTAEFGSTKFQRPDGSTYTHFNL